MITVTQATITDIPVIQAIAQQTWPVTFGEILSPEQIRYMLAMMYSTEALSQQMHEKKHVFLLVQDTENQQYLGFASYEVNYKEEPKTKIHKLYLLPGSQGKGLGRQLIDEVASRAMANQNSTLSLNVNKHNKAIQFYERLGFKTVDTETIDIGNGFVMDDRIMEKQVQ